MDETYRHTHGKYDQILIKIFMLFGVLTFIVSIVGIVTSISNIRHGTSLETIEDKKEFKKN